MTPNENPARAQAAANTRKLIEWAVEAVRKPLPEPVRRRAAIILSDDIGAMVAGSLETQVARAREGLLRTSSGKAEATVLAKGAPRADRYAAASANGMAITWCELDEGFRNASCHGGAYTIPALLAESEAQGRTTEEVLRALAVAYEVTTRFALAFPFPVFNVHPHAAFAAIGGAAAASLARKQDAETMLAAGIGGNDVTPYDVFVGAYKTNAKPDALVAGLGDTWSVTNGYHKVFACCGYAHSAVEATLELLGRMQKKKKEEITEIVVEAAPGGQALRNAEPETVLAAKFSMPHAIAATVQLGTAGARAFTQDKLEDAEISKLRKRVRLQPYPNIKPAPNDRPARVTMRFNDGAEMSAVVESARGGADKPFDEPTLLSKLAENSAAVFPAVPETLKKVIAGDSDLLSQSWRDALARMVKT
jgi:2-methylcitrate dehydratase PrpD